MGDIVVVGDGVILDVSLIVGVILADKLWVGVTLELGELETEVVDDGLGVAVALGEGFLITV